MKITTYKCDCDGCNNQTNNIELDNWIEIGSGNRTLFVNNYLKNNNLISLNKYGSIHFCSSECLCKFFLK